MHSPVNWALLGLVIERPSHPYELAQRFDRAYSGVLALSSVSHVYTALAALKGRSLVEEVPGTRGGRPAKARYRATETGIEGYREWLVGQVGEERRRQQLLVLQLGGLTHDPQTALAILAEYEQACLAEATRTPIGRASPDRGADSTLLGRLVAEDNRLAVTAKLAWVDYARREFAALVTSGPEKQ
jgi:DNA-binding PadR family transcriptional regulator